MMNKVRKKRLIALAMILAGVTGAVSLFVFALGQNLNHFFTPSELAAGGAEPGRRVRVGGMVKEGSVKRDADSLKVEFIVTDYKSDVMVEYVGILPDLFREGQGIVSTGRFVGNARVKADEVLAKHDENYMPPEAYEALKRAQEPPHDI